MGAWHSLLGMLDHQLKTGECVPRMVGPLPLQLEKSPCVCWWQKAISPAATCQRGWYVGLAPAQIFMVEMTNDLVIPSLLDLLLSKSPRVCLVLWT